MIFVILIALTLAILYGGYILAGMLLLSVMSTAISLVTLLVLLVVIPVLWFREEIAQARAKARYEKLAANAAAVAERLEHEYELRHAITPQDRREQTREDARKHALFDKMRRIEELERARQR
ncbi:hypothetical protein AWB81_08250 [Caballeronia arationis]|uniref:hypothetical protein n=1 Tax=Caballeronia arationis TaxID=1777142 RepID=UPI00074CC6F3|nr:hypothetical protein [Caballeronia arationis]SAL07718.1 hypothetical protein AWB81_08250 [Caballeronia arationis]